MPVCNICEGEGGWQEWVEYWKLPYEECPICKGTGRIDWIIWFWQNAPIRFVEWYGDWRYKDAG